MKKIFFLPLFFICLLTFQSLAQESKEASPPPSDPELLRLTIKPNYDCISGGFVAAARIGAGGLQRIIYGGGMRGY